MINKKKTILIVEDEIPLLNAIRTKLENEDIYTLTARSVEQAIDYIESTEVDLIWLDHYLLGKEDGLDLVQKIKENDKYKKIPIFVVSNTASNNKFQTYLSLGVEKYYVKSNCKLDDIISDISGYIE